MASQGTFEDRIGKYTAGDTLIQSWEDYDPANPLITKAGSAAFIAAVETANTAVTTVMNTYGSSNRDRKELYDGDNQMADRITMIKNYLASFPGKKKNNHYIEYSQAIKGS